MRVKKKILIEKNKIRRKTIRRNEELSSIFPELLTSVLHAGFISDSNRYISEIGVISLLEPCSMTDNCYEIYCIEGNLFDYVERYCTLDEAENRIKKLLL